MKPLPHEYSAKASAERHGNVRLTSGALPALESAPPLEFDGPGDQWSPEELLLAAVADCFVLTFCAITRASKLPWTRLEASAEGLLDRAERVTRFTEITVRAILALDEAEAHQDEALRLLERAEKNCLVSNSLAVPVTLEARVE